MKISSVLWDVDGTLLDFKAAESAAVKSLFAEFGMGSCTDEMVRRYSVINDGLWKQLERGEIGRQEVLIRRFEIFFAEIGADPGLAEAFNQKYQHRLGDTIVPKGNSLETVRALRGKVRQYVVSNGTVTAQSKKLCLSGLGALMDSIFLSEQLGAEKPSRVFFDAVFQSLGENCRHTSMIVGDSLTSDILGGMNAGIRTCWYNPDGLPAPEGYRIDEQICDLRQVIALVK